MRKLIISLIALMTVTIMQAQQTVKQTYLTLNNGVQMPQFGLGVYSIADGDDTYNSVLTALKCGYRHIDTAHAYRRMTRRYSEHLGFALSSFRFSPQRGTSSEGQRHRPLRDLDYQQALA